MRLSRLLLVTAACLAALTAPALAQNNSKEIMSKGLAELVAIVKDPAAGVFDKAKACQRLAVIGTADTVPALAALLPDETLNAYARYGLEGIGGPAASEALRAAAGKLHGRPLIGVIESLGHLKDAQALPRLKSHYRLSSDPHVVAAAAAALGQIGTPEAAALLAPGLVEKSPFLRDVADACMACAEGLAAAGKTAEAVALYDAVAKANVPKHIKTAAATGAFRVQPAKAKELVLGHLRSTDVAFFNLGLALARKAAGADVTAALVAELPKLPAERQALLLRALGDRKDRVPSAVVVAATKSESTAIREAAIAVLADTRDPAAGSILLDAALGDGPVADKAKEGLTNLPGQAADALIVARLSGANGSAKMVLFELAGARRIASAQPVLQKAVGDSDPAVRLAAIAALAQLVDVPGFDLLASRALSGEAGDEVKAAREALRGAALRATDADAAAAKLASYLSGANADNQSYLMELIGKVSGPKALEIVGTAAKSEDAATKDLATRVLGEWVNPEAAPALLEIAKSDPDARYQVRALRGYIRIGRQLQMPDAARLAMFQSATEAAKRNDEKKLALEILTRVTDVAQPQALEIAVAQLSSPPVKDAAADAAIKIATKLVALNPQPVVAAMQKVIDAKVAAPHATKARQLLEQARSAGK